MPANFPDRPQRVEPPRTRWPALPFAAGVIIGSQLFSRLSDLRLREFTMVFMLLVVVGRLLA